MVQYARLADVVLILVSKKKNFNYHVVGFLTKGTLTVSFFAPA